MKTSPDANKGGLGQPQHFQTRAGTSPPSHTSDSKKRRPPKAGESLIGNMTIFRAPNFFVHAVPRRPSGNTSRLEQIRWASTERKIRESETRLLPNTNLVNPLFQTEIVIPVWIEAFVVLGVLGIGMFIHAWGINLFPAYQQSEGLLMANAWAVTHNMIQPYAYTYTQTFLGWMQIAGWLRLTGGFMTFGNAINSGRALMLILCAASGLFVYLIANRLSHSRSAGLLALALFAFSPLAIGYQREVSLDTIGTFWLLLSLYLLVISDSRLAHIVFAGVALGIAILTKEVFIVFLPAMIYAVWVHVTAFQRKFVLVVFIYLVCSLVSLLALFAILKGELPNLWAGTIANIQAAQQESNFSSTWNVWMQELPLFIVSAVATGINLLVGWHNPLRSFLALLLISFWAFLLTTNIIFPAYIVIFLPLMALNVAVAVSALMMRPSNRFGFDFVRVMLIFGLLGLLIPYRIQDAQAQPLLTQNATNVQTSTLNWIRNHKDIPTNSTIILDTYLYADLHEPEGPNDKVYPHAHIYWNVVLDPAVRYEALCDNWQYIDYIILSSRMQNDIRTRPSDTYLIDQALHHATLIQTFNDPNGDPSAAVRIYKVEHPTPPVSRGCASGR